MSRILLVEDSAVDARLVGGMLRGSGLEVDLVTSLAEALEDLLTTGADLVLLDLGLPDSHGLETFRRLSNTVPDVPVVVFSGRDDVSTVEEAVKLGAQDFLVKGEVSRALLLRSIKYAIERHRAIARSAQLNSVLQAIRQVDQVIVRERDPQRLIEAVCQALVDSRRYHAAVAVIDRPEGDPQGQCSVAAAGSARGQAASLLEQARLGGPACRKRAHEEDGRLAFLDGDLCRDCPIACGQPGRNGALLLRHGQRHQGLLAVSLAGRSRFDDEEASLLEGVAGDLGLALHSAALERDRQRLETSYQSVFHSVSDAILVHDSDSGALVMVNEPAVRLFGWSAEELLELSIADWSVGPLSTQQEGLARIHRARDGATELFEWHCRDKAGRQFWAEVSLRRAEIDGQPRVLAVLRDFTERRQLQASLAQSERLASVGLLAAGLAHEINNPLTCVLYNLDTLVQGLRGSAEPELAALARGAEEALEGSNRVREIVKDLNTLARVDQQREAPTSLNAVIDGAINVAHSAIKLRARLVKDYSQVPELLANDGKLAQVFLNLLLNAAQSIDEGQPEQQTIRVRTWATDDEVLAEVADSGKGIPAEELGRLFDPFYTTKGIGAGSGLGLSICQNIVTAMGGRIEVQSTEGVGSRFVVHLPRRSDGPDPDSTRELEAVQTVDRRRLLLVDDDAQVGKTIRRMLEAKHDVVLVSSGDEAMAQLDGDHAFDGVICDLMMPGVSGVDLHRWLAEHDRPLADQMIFITGGVFTPQARAFLDGVSNPWLEKPFDRKKLERLLRNLRH